MFDEIGESAGDDSSIESTSKISDPSPELVDNSVRHRKYESEWRILSSGVEEVRRLALTGALRCSHMRSLAWAILLDVLPPESDKWLDTLRRNRQIYSDIKQKLSCDPRCCDHPEDNPLSQQDESMWNQHFQDAELQTLIKLDVVRSFPGIEFFKQAEIQTTMVNVLFCFARETPRLLYRQGMHEILAPLLFVLQSDHRAAEHSQLGEDLTEIMNPEYLEHDSYALFKVIMAGIETFYRLNDIPTDTSYLPPCPPKANNITNRRPENEVVRHLALIRDRLLIPQDPELAEHLNKCDIALSLFGIRWLRVLFGREFALHDLLVLWDAIFAAGKDFSLAGFTMVAMLIAIRSLLLNSDSMVCLTHLMHYPTTIDVQYIIDHALYLKHPEQYSKPIPRPFTSQAEVLPSTPTMSNKRKPKSRPKPSVPVNEDKNSIPNIKVASTADDSAIVDGYTLQEPEVLREELLHAHSVMALCDLKLEQYEETLQRSLPPTLGPTHPAHQALGGIRELCTLLKSRYHTPSEVEPALEANEVGDCQEKSTSKLPEKAIAQTSASVKLVKAIKTNKRTPGAKQIIPSNNPKEVALKVINIVNSTSEVVGAPNADPLGLRKD